MIQRLFTRQFVRLTPWCTSTMCALLALVVSALSTPALAQDDIRPPKSTQALSAPIVMTIVVAVLLTAAVVFVATRKSKRTHQD